MRTLGFTGQAGEEMKKQLCERKEQQPGSSPARRQPAEACSCLKLGSPSRDLGASGQEEPAREEVAAASGMQLSSRMIHSGGQEGDVFVLFLNPETGFSEW